KVLRQHMEQFERSSSTKQNIAQTTTAAPQIFLVDNLLPNSNQFQKSNQTQKLQTQVKNNKLNLLNNLFSLISIQKPLPSTDMEVDYPLSSPKSSSINQLFGNNISTQLSNSNQTNSSKGTNLLSTIPKNKEINNYTQSLSNTSVSNSKQPNEPKSKSKPNLLYD
ncbi:4146_t:CDS:2, partial [Dentiscutata erythropus]